MRSTVLLVDEEPANLTSFVNHLQRRGYDVLLSDNGNQAVEAATQTVPDLILLDTEMLGMDSYETCRAIRANEASAAIPVIFLTTLLNQEDCLKGFAAGGVDCPESGFCRRAVYLHAFLAVEDHERFL